MLALLADIASSAPAPDLAHAAPSTPATDKVVDDARHELYLSSGFLYYASDRRVQAGLGGGPGYRLSVSSHFALHAEARWLVYVGNAFAASAGVTYRFRVGFWEPHAGVQALGINGDRIEVIASDHPRPEPTIAWAVQGLISPARFVQRSFAVSVGALAFGFGADGGSRATAIEFHVLDVGLRL